MKRKLRFVRSNSYGLNSCAFQTVRSLARNVGGGLAWRPYLGLLFLWGKAPKQGKRFVGSDSYGRNSGVGFNCPVAGTYCRRRLSKWLRLVNTQCNTMQCNTTQCNAMQCHATQCNAMRAYAMQCNAMQFNATQCNGMLCNTM